MNGNLKIRKYKFSDKTKLIEILRLNVPEYFDESEINDFDNYLDKELEEYFVVEWNNKVVGAGGINFESNKTIGKISWDFIHPNFQGIGVGSKLLKYRLELLKTIDNLKVISVRTSQLAYGFYENHGFVLKEIHKDYWAKGFDMYKMVYDEK